MKPTEREAELKNQLLIRLFESLSKLVLEETVFNLVSNPSTHQKKKKIFLFFLLAAKEF